MVTIFTLTYNEEVLLPHFISHYRKNFPKCNIVIYDNESTDKTIQIAKDNDCEVITYNTNGRILDSKYLNIKNNCWKNSKTDWNFVCDCDEFCEINENDLINIHQNGCTLVKFSGYDMVNINNDPDNISINNITNGIRNTVYDKILFFNKKRISDINYQPGCHTCNPIGDIVYNKTDYKLLHYKYIGENYLVNRYKIFNQRLSEENKNKNWGYHYQISENKIREYIKKIKSESEKIL